MGNLISGLSKVDLNDNNKITPFNFLQGCIRNCGMVSTMSTIANDQDLYNKVVPTGQNFNSNDPSKVMFNLYKLGRLNQVVVNKWLFYSGNELLFCSSSNNNLLGPLLEKALVKLHFDGNYELAECVPPYFFMSSFTKNYFEEFLFPQDGNFRDIDKLINYGLKTKCQMIIDFKDDQAKKSNLKARHYYSFLDVEKNENNLVKLYDPHGEIVLISKKNFVKAIETFEICYSENKVFGIPEIKTDKYFINKWATLKRNEKIHFVEYIMEIREDYTEILINVIPEKFSGKIKQTIFIMTNYEEKKLLKSSPSAVKKNSKIEYFHRNSLRANLKRGQYRIVVVMSRFNKFKSCEESRKYFKNGGNKFLFRLAASKQCTVAKSLKKETDEIEKVLFDWHARLLSRKNYSEENLCNIL